PRSTLFPYTTLFRSLSLRGGAVLKNVLALLSEFGLPLTYLDAVLSSDTLRGKLLRVSKNPAVRFYFERHFVQEGKQTIAALRARDRKSTRLNSSHVA